MWFKTFSFLLKKFLLNLLVWHWLIKVYRSIIFYYTLHVKLRRAKWKFSFLSRTFQRSKKHQKDTKVLCIDKYVKEVYTKKKQPWLAVHGKIKRNGTEDENVKYKVQTQGPKFPKSTSKNNMCRKHWKVSFPWTSISLFVTKKKKKRRILWVVVQNMDSLYETLLNSFCNFTLQNLLK